MKCNACSSTNLIEGRIMDDAGSSSEKFNPKDRSGFMSWFGVGTREISSFACAHCGNLQFIVNFTDEDRKRYAKFEGEQPDLLRRIENEN